MFGNDKIILITKDYEIKDVFNLSLVPHTKQQGKEFASFSPLFECKGEEYNIQKAHHNGDFVNFDISGYGLKVAFNPSKISGELVYESKDIIKATKTVEGYLKSVGVNTSLFSTSISRLDLAQDRTVNNTVNNYASEFRMLKGSRVSQKKQFPDGYTMGNRVRQVCFYDKGKLKNNSKVNSNLMRGEVRLLTSEACKKTLETNLFSEFLRRDRGEMKEIYSNYMSKNVFNLNESNGGFLNSDFLEERERLKELNNKMSRGAVNTWLCIGGVNEKLKILGGWDGIKDALFYAELHKGTVYKKLNEMKKIYEEEERNKQIRGEKSQYLELVDKFMKVA